LSCLCDTLAGAMVSILMQLHVLKTEREQNKECVGQRDS
jgi:hypothetical protein